MIQENLHFQNLQSPYIFPIIEKKISDFQRYSPHKKIYNFGIGDVVLPLATSIATAICDAVKEMTKSPIGYGPAGGYPFLKKAICQHEYQQYEITSQEIFISEGASADISGLLELFEDNTVVAIADPNYPAYRDTTIIGGKKIVFIPLLEEKGFIPTFPKEQVDLVYLCTPCNPTGISLNDSQLQNWVNWAKKNQAILLIDNVYHSFISSSNVPHSIYAIKGAKEVAIEMRSFSKTAGFTGLRCGYTVVPKTLFLPQLHKLWIKRTEIKTNGISYPIQKGALAYFSPQGQKEVHSQTALYKESAQILCKTLKELNQTFFGGIDAPYIWWKAPLTKTSWEFFDELLHHIGWIGIPGSGFGKFGEGYIRISSFILPETAKEACDALHDFLIPA